MKKAILLILTLIMVFLIVGCVENNESSSSNQWVAEEIEQVEVPGVVGKNISEATTILESLGFKVAVDESFSDQYEKGYVLNQEKAIGMVLPKGANIKLYVSKGPDLVQVPNVKGKTLMAATKALLDAGLEIKSDIKCSSSVKEDLIISQDIKSGELVKRGSAVFVYVSAGAANKVGNTPSNSAQRGYVAQRGNWVYYNNVSDDYSLYRMKNDGTEKQLLDAACALNINVVGEWVYYSIEDRNNGGIYKIRIDGTKKTKICSDKSTFVHVANGWIYNWDMFGDRTLYRRKLDGTQKQSICQCDGNITIVGDWIYYFDSNWHICKIRTDGTQKTKLRSSADTLCFAVEGNTLVGDGFAYFTMDTDKRDCKEYEYYSNIQKSFININDGWVYFLELEFLGANQTKETLYKMKSDTSQKTKIMDVKYSNIANNFICAADGWLYFQNENDSCHLYRVKTDGTSLQKVHK